MAKRAGPNPFENNRAKSKSTTKKVATTALPNDEYSLIRRAEKRKNLDLSAISLKVCNKTSNKPFRRSFVMMVGDHPHYEILIKQLLQGAHLDVGSRIVSYQSNQDCYYGIEEFIGSLDLPGLQNQKQIRCVADLNYQVTKNFVAYLLQQWPGRSANRKRYGSLKRIIQKLQKQYDGDPQIGKNFSWAQSPGNTDTPSESYPDHIFNQLIEASLTDVKFVMNMMKEYPATLAEYKVKIQGKKFTVQRNSGRTIGGAPGVINEVPLEESPKYVMALAATASPTWPLYDDLGTAISTYSDAWYRSNDGDEHNRKIHRALQLMRITYSLKNHKSGEITGNELHVGQMAYLAHFFFTFKTLYPFFLLIQLNTGWNSEAILSLSDDLDHHIGEDLIDPDHYALIYGSKWRTEDVLYCRSSKAHPYSVYNLLRFIQARIIPFKDSPHYQTGRLWQGIISKNMWTSVESLVMEFDAKIAQTESKSFMVRHGIVIESDAAVPSIESKRIRTTWETKRKEQGLPVELISPMMGHKDINTTVINYDSDTGSTNLRNKKLRNLQESWDSDFRNYEVRLSTSTTLTELRAAIKSGNRKNVVAKVTKEIGNTSEESVVHLLAPESQTYIAACLDSKKPTWPGAARFVANGSKCSFFNRCCMCKQAVIFKEALPYVARRVSDLDDLRTRITAMEWASNYGDEMTGWENILVRWVPTSDVDEAKALSAKSEFALPLTMRGA